MNRAPTTLRLPSHLPFPLTVTSFLLKPDCPIKKHDGLLVYKFSAYVSEEQDEDQEEKRVRKEMVEQFDSPWEGILTEWLIEEGAVVSSARYAFILLSELSLVNLLSQSLNHVYMRSLTRTSVRFVEQIYQCTARRHATLTSPDAIILATCLLNPTSPCRTTTLTSKLRMMYSPL